MVGLEDLGCVNSTGLGLMDEGVNWLWEFGKLWRLVGVVFVIVLTFISTVSIAVTCTLCPTIHTISLLLTQPYRLTLDAWFHILF